MEVEHRSLGEDIGLLFLMILFKTHRDLMPMIAVGMERCKHSIPPYALVITCNRVEPGS